MLYNASMAVTFLVPPIDIRERIGPELIAEIANQIARQFDPKQIILFGSYAYGTPRPESDVDFLVVMETPLSERRQALKIRQFLNPLFGLDLLVYTPANLAQRLAWGDGFLHEIVSKGKVLYESTHA
jgi:uncharacterized protein